MARDEGRGPRTLQELSDEELIEEARGCSSSDSAVYLETLYRRFYPRVAYWCFKFCGDRDQAADLAQDVFLRIHSKLDSFRNESRFSTWLYVVARRVAINRGLAESRRGEVQAVLPSEPADPSPDVETVLEKSEVSARVRDALESELEPLESKILYLHYVDGLTLPAITNLLKLRNKSGAKAYVVSGKRKMQRRLGRWLRAAQPAASRSPGGS